MRPFSFSAILYLLVFNSVPAAAQSPVHFDCAAPKDYFSAFTQALPGGQFRVSGTLRVDEPMAGRFMPTMGVAIRTSGDNATVVARLVHEQGEQKVALVVDQIVNGTMNHVVLGKAAVHADVPFVISGDAIGNVQVTLGSKEASADLGASAVTLEFSCSSGDFDFGQVVIDDGG